MLPASEPSKARLLLFRLPHSKAAGLGCPRGLWLPEWVQCWSGHTNEKASLPAKWFWATRAGLVSDVDTWSLKCAGNPALLAKECRFAASASPRGRGQLLGHIPPQPSGRVRSYNIAWSRCRTSGNRLHDVHIPSSYLLITSLCYTAATNTPLWSNYTLIKM